jgi:NarL family two-component system response regulator LiaR
MRKDSESTMIKVAIIDDDIKWIKLINQYLNDRDHIMVSWSATNQEEAVKFAKSDAVDIIFMDINLDAGQKENYDGIFATIEVLESEIKAKVVILTNLTDDELVINSIIAGAVDYISKENFKELPQVIDSIMVHEHSPLKIISKEYAKLRKDMTLQILTPAEHEVLCLLEQRFTRSQIAEQLCITPDCVKKHVGHIFKKLEAKDTAEVFKKIKLKSLVSIGKKKG